MAVGVDEHVEWHDSDESRVELGWRRASTFFQTQTLQSLLHSTYLARSRARHTRTLTHHFFKFCVLFFFSSGDLSEDESRGLFLLLVSLLPSSLFFFASSFVIFEQSSKLMLLPLTPRSFQA